MLLEQQNACRWKAPLEALSVSSDSPQASRIRPLIEGLISRSFRRKGMPCEDDEKAMVNFLEGSVEALRGERSPEFLSMA